ncbi:MAG: prepilin-type N-terminal cleavage/methylation domain-containing protein [Patescibacteria group bacterium]
MPKTLDTQSGFTLIELMLTVIIIGVLSGIVITIISPTNTRNKAKDGVRAGTLAKLAQAVEAFTAGENLPPANETALTAATSQYVQTWPTDSDFTAASTDNYRFVRFGAGTSANPYSSCASVRMATATTYFKYVSPYTNPPMTNWSAVAPNPANPSGRLLRNCTYGCAAGASPNSLVGCLAI